MSCRQYKSVNVAIDDRSVWSKYKDWCFRNKISMQRHVGILIAAFVKAIETDEIQCPFCRMDMPLSSLIEWLSKEVPE